MIQIRAIAHPTCPSRLCCESITIVSPTSGEVVHTNHGLNLPCSRRFLADGFACDDEVRVLFFEMNLVRLPGESHHVEEALDPLDLRQGHLVLGQ